MYSFDCESKNWVNTVRFYGHCYYCRQPEVNVGQCWAFKGSMGFLVIQLASVIKPTAFTLEHLPKSMSPTGSIDSAPRDFTVLVSKHLFSRAIGVYPKNSILCLVVYLYGNYHIMLFVLYWPANK